MGCGRCIHTVGSPQSSNSVGSHEVQHCRGCPFTLNLGRPSLTRTRTVAEAGDSLVWCGARANEKARGSDLDTAPPRSHRTTHVPGIKAPRAWVSLAADVCFVQLHSTHRPQCIGIRRSNDVCRSQPGPWLRLCSGGCRGPSCSERAALSFLATLVRRLGSIPARWVESGPCPQVPLIRT